MSRVLASSSVRTLLLFLVVWTIVDGALYVACAEDRFGLGGTGETSVAACGCRHHPTDSALHAHHCFCHAQWVGVADTALPEAPARSSRLAADASQRRPDSLPRLLDHPPQLLLA
jgi:hypothetical protein